MVTTPRLSTGGCFLQSRRPTRRCYSSGLRGEDDTPQCIGGGSRVLFHIFPHFQTFYVVCSTRAGHHRSLQLAASSWALRGTDLCLAAAQRDSCPAAHI